MTIAALAIMAIAAVKAYRASTKNDPDGTQGKIHNIRQSTAVVLAIGEAIWAVLDALISLTRSRQSGGGNGQQLQPRGSFGTRIAADVPAEA